MEIVLNKYVKMISTEENYVIFAYNLAPPTKFISDPSTIIMRMPPFSV